MITKSRYWVKPKAWLVVTPEISYRLRRDDYVRYKGRWLVIYRITEDSGIQLSNFKYVCLTELDDFKE
jgi:hypothetical protein